MSIRGTSSKSSTLIRESCRAERVALLLVTHSPEVAEQFERVENLESFNRAAANSVAKPNDALVTPL